MLLSGCASNLQVAPNPETHRYLSAADKDQPRQIELYFDGTANDWVARSNVRRRFEMIACKEDPARPCCYIEGVGVKTLSGKAFGIGLEKRVREGYAFLARHWRKGDKIVIFGFSRGAFEARMLTGMMAHCGLPDATAESVVRADVDRLVEQVWSYCRDELKDPYEVPGETGVKRVNDFRSKLSENQRSTAANFQESGFKFNAPTINFLGLWDTVPGLPFAKFREYGAVEEDHPQLYKVRPYPNVKVIAHALALDECRSRFDPLLVGPPIDSSATTVYEVWFPGAHSDVGGGYADSNDMAGTSLNWIQRIMMNEKVTSQASYVYADTRSVMHHPEEDRFSSFGSEKLRRSVPVDSVIDESVFIRANADSHLVQAKAKSTGYAWRKYAPIIQVRSSDGKLELVQVKPARTTKEREAVLGPHLKLNRSDTLPGNPVEKIGPPLPVGAMEVHAAAAPATP